MPVIEITVPEGAAEQTARFTELLGVEPGCSFADQNWDYPAFTLGPPHLMCDAHHEIGHSSIYAADPGEEVGLCKIQHDRLVEAATDEVYRELDRALAANPIAMLGAPT